MSPEQAQAPLRELRSAARIHMIGVAGAGMNALAAVLLERGFSVSGTDQQRTVQMDRLAAQGLVFHQGHSASQVDGADLVVISAAVRESNVELAAARSAGIPVVKRAVALGWLLEPLKTIAVAGTHGKTTTSAMAAFILDRAGFDPSYVIGSEVLDLGASASFGNGDWAVVEADEYDRSFLQLRPTVALITNVEPDHLEYYGSIEAMHEAYDQFVERVAAGGTLVINASDAHLSRMVVPDRLATVTCALAPCAAQWQAGGVVEGIDGTSFAIRGPFGETPARLPVPGRHNVLNGLQAIAACAIAGVEVRTAVEALADFHGTSRRFQLVGEAGGVTVYDDYAHHPTEIRATLSAARARFAGRRIVAVFQPHTYSRTKLLFDDFVSAFDVADHVILTEIYASRETDTLGMRASLLAEALEARLGPGRATLVGGLQEVPPGVLAAATAGDVVLTIGAGSITEAGPLILNALRLRAAGRRDGN
jgi:UDP-N-acetylmuramate--alanine ligase